MKKGSLIGVLLILSMIMMFSSVFADESAEKNINLAKQLRFTNINYFINTFYITDSGKAVMESALSARDVDQCKVSMYLQKYQNGSWVNVKHWSNLENSTYCDLGKTWYLVSGFQYRMKTYGYVYRDGSLVDYTTFVSSGEIY